MPRTSAGSIVRGKRKLTDKQVWEARKVSGPGTRTLAERYGVDRKTVQSVRNGSCLSHVPNPGAEQLTVEQLMYLLSHHPPHDLIDMETLCIEVRQGFSQDNEPEET